MYKTTSRNLQKVRGRDCSMPKLRPRKVDARATADELLDFTSGDKPFNAHLDEMRLAVKRLRGTTKLRPGQLAKLLNDDGLRTNHGQHWNERRVILLTRLLAEQSRKRAKAAKALPNPVVPSATSKAPLSPAEGARRLSVLGRIKGG